MQNKFKQPDIEEYILSHINSLQEILSHFNYPNLSNFIKLIRREFLWQSKLIKYLEKNKDIPRPIIIDIPEK